MKNILKTFVLGIAVISCSLGVAKDGIKFEKNISIDEMKLLATQQDKIIFIDAYATWCGPCKYMSNDVFTNKEVGDFFNKNFINVKLDMESENGEIFDMFYDISAYPTLIFINKDGEVMKKQEGALDENDLLEMAEIVLDPSKDPIHEMLKTYNEGEKDADFLVELVAGLSERGMQYDSIVEEYFVGKDIDFENQSDIMMFYFETSNLSDKNVEKLMAEPKLFLEKGGEQIFFSKIKEVIINELMNVEKVDKQSELKAINKFIKKVMSADSEVDPSEWIEQVAELYDSLLEEE
jgi:thioredoxin-related protein